MRRLCRRERYWAEFFAPLWGSFAVELSRRLKAIADALGDLHDADVALERLTGQEMKLPEGLTPLLRKRRRTAWKDYNKAWASLRRKKFQKRVVKSLTSA